MALPQAPRCVITGAGSGFGRALAVGLASRGAHLLLSDIDVASVRETAAVAADSGAASVHARSCDVTQFGEVAALAEACEGPLDLLVNNAGVSSGGAVGELAIEDWGWTIQTDLLGAVYGCHAFVPRLRAQGHGHILNVASAAGFISAPSMGAYNAAKAGVIALSETLAAELAGTRIGVTVLCPTFFRSNIARSGRFAAAVYRAAAQRLVERGKPVELVVQAALDAVEKNRLYCVPTADARWLWRLKRLAPAPFSVLFGKLAARRLRTPVRAPHK
ncbi:MAG TPA: SDR family NAD(P)-dependent oxidoreductase [Polyangiaceae bacterium]|nr:SDR family NAD(P)-dependent oxidoreductase [Polyangiaceae bacterium]